MSCAKAGNGVRAHVEERVWQCEYAAGRRIPLSSRSRQELMVSVLLKACLMRAYSRRLQAVRSTHPAR